MLKISTVWIIKYIEILGNFIAIKLEKKNKNLQWKLNIPKYYPQYTFKNYNYNR